MSRCSARRRRIVQPQGGWEICITEHKIVNVTDEMHTRNDLNIGHVLYVALHRYVGRLVARLCEEFRHLTKPFYEF